MKPMSFQSAVAIVEAAFWPDGPTCPRCPTANRFVRVASRNGRWHRCLSCYTCSSATAGSFLHKVRSPLNKVLCLIALRIASPNTYVSVLAAKADLPALSARSLLRVWDANKDTPDGQRLEAALFDFYMPAKVAKPKVAKPAKVVAAPHLIDPSHPMHGLL